jgi:hypothetical protein
MRPAFLLRIKIPGLAKISVNGMKDYRTNRG